MTKAVRAAAAFCGLALLLHPLFFVIYRMSLFNTVPRDDYAWYLLWLLGQPGGFVPDSPYAYRILSMLLAAPFALLPAIPLTNTPAGLPPEYLRATAALSMLAYLAWVGTALLAYATARQQRLGRAEALLAGALALALMSYVQFTAIDPLAVLLIAAGVLCLHRPFAFAALLAVSVPVNEKVALVLATWLALRCLLSRTDRAALRRSAATAIAATLAYVALVALLRLPGNAYQQTPGHYPATILANLAAYATPRGLLLNVLPLGILLALLLVSRPTGRFSRLDALLVPALAGIALVLTQFFQAGRIAMHAAPILVVPAAAGILAWLRAQPPAQPHAAHPAATHHGTTP